MEPFIHKQGLSPSGFRFVRLRVDKSSGSDMWVAKYNLS